ncbi:MAG: HEAT repeat domain-containing protein [Calditrichaeota bacterium]|nr:MAG: HEAT repeat domain-containing protein [Calditrichota bacterium]
MTENSENTEPKINPIRSGSKSLGFMFVFMGIVILALFYAVFESFTYQNLTSEEHIVDLKENDDLEKRVYSALRLGELADTTAIPQLLSSLRNEPDKYVRGRCAEALGKMGTRSTIPALLEIVETDSTSLVKVYAIWAIGNLQAETAIEPLSKYLGSEDSFVRLNVIQSLGEIGSPNGLEILQNYKTKNALEDSVLEVSISKLTNKN